MVASACEVQAVLRYKKNKPVAKKRCTLIAIYKGWFWICQTCSWQPVNIRCLVSLRIRHQIQGPRQRRAQAFVTQTGSAAMRGQTSLVQQQQRRFC
jgi:hypothetical protein